MAAKIIEEFRKTQQVMFFCSHRCSGANVLLWWYQLPPLMRRSYCSLIIHHYNRAQISPGYLLIRLVFFIYLCLHVATKAVTIAWIKDPILPWSLSNFKLLLNIVHTVLSDSHTLPLCLSRRRLTKWTMSTASCCSTKTRCCEKPVCTKKPWSISPPTRNRSVTNWQWRRHEVGHCAPL